MDYIYYEKNLKKLYTTRSIQVLSVLSLDSCITTTSSSSSGVIQYVSSSLVKTASNLSYNGYWVASSSVGDYAIIYGGNSLTNGRVISTNLVGTLISIPSSYKYHMGATTVGNFAIFAGGYGSTTTVDIYDSNLTRSISNLSEGRGFLAATTVGNFAIFGGGYQLGAKDVVEVITLV